MYLEALQALFPRTNDVYDEDHLPRLHEVVLGLTDSPLETELALGGLDINETDSRGWTALFWACRRNDSNAIASLLNAGADPNISNPFRCSPLLHAAGAHNLRSIQDLLDAGADVSQVTDSNETALHSVVLDTYRYRTDVTCQSQAQRETIQLLVTAGINIDVQNNYGISALGLATRHDNDTAVETLLDLGAEIDAVDHGGDTALLSAIKLHNPKSTALLLQRGASYTTVNYKGETILHCAAHPDDLEILSFILAARVTGVDPNARDNAGNSAFQLAMTHEPKPEGFVDMFRALLSDISNRNDPAKSDGNDAGKEKPKIRDESVCEDKASDGLEVPGAWPE